MCVIGAELCEEELVVVLASVVPDGSPISSASEMQPDPAPRPRPAMSRAIKRRERAALSDRQLTYNTLYIIGLNASDFYLILRE